MRTFFFSIPSSDFLELFGGTEQYFNLDKKKPPIRAGKVNKIKLGKTTATTKAKLLIEARLVSIVYQSKKQKYRFHFETKAGMVRASFEGVNPLFFNGERSGIFRTKISEELFKKLKKEDVF